MTITKLALSIPSEQQEFQMNSLLPLTKRALELAKDIPPVPADWDYREELINALIEKYNIRRLFAHGLSDDELMRL